MDRKIPSTITIEVSANLVMCVAYWWDFQDTKGQPLSSFEEAAKAVIAGGIFHEREIRAKSCRDSGMP